jgi:tRNA-2-methylthio-N6-dimethylallyladenosine synthase
MNVCDSEWLHRALAKRGWHNVPESEADVILVNTCSVREKPEQKVYSLLGRLAAYGKDKPNFFVGVGGCVAQQIGRAFWERFPHVRLVFGTDGIASVPDSLDRLVEEPGLRLSLLEFTQAYPEREAAYPDGAMPAQAYVNIMQGCDNYCAYCIVPYTRGRQKSRSCRAVLEECRQLVHSGVREITLLGQNVNSFGKDDSGDGTSFAQLLDLVCSLPGLDRVRFTTSHPKDLAPDVIGGFGRLPALCPGLHLPLQSGSNRILQSMGRKYTREGYLELVRALRSHRPDIVLSTDLIVGFPGETEDDFQQTMELVQQVGFDSSFSFKYSDRPGVRSASFSGKVPEAIKAERLGRLQALQQQLTQASLNRLLGSEAEVLVEGRSPKANGSRPSWAGREPGGRIVHFVPKASGDLIGRMVRVRINKAHKHSVSGEVIEGP